MKKTILSIAHRRKCILSITLGLLLNLSYAQKKEFDHLIPKFDTMLSAQFKSNETGVTVLASRKGKIIYKKAFGMANLELNVPMQIDNVFRIGSLTKQFTAIAILQLIEQGKLKLQDEITTFIQDYPTKGNKITIEHLLTHTSGIQDYSTIRDSINRGTLEFSPIEMIERFKDHPLRFTPGTKWEYSNSGYFLLGYVIEKITLKSYAKYLEENFFKPLGMTNSYYASDIKIIKQRASGYSESQIGYENAAYLSMSQPYAAGSIQSTVEDLFKWHQALTSFKLVKKQSLEKAFSKYKLLDGSETAYGFGWRVTNVYESPAIWHGGLINGFFSMGVYLPKEDVYVVALSNCDCNSPEIVTFKLASLAGGRAYEYNAKRLANNILSEYIGVYENSKGQQRIITVLDNKLFSQLGRGPKSLIKPSEKDLFFVDSDAMSTIKFARTQTGEINNLTFASVRGYDVWIKTKKPLPNENGILLNENLLEALVGVYAVSENFSFSITRVEKKVFLQGTGQEKIEMYADSPTTFFLKVNDAQLEFVKDENGKIVKAIIKQNGRETVARKVK